MNAWCECGHHRDSHSGGEEVIGRCWAAECPCQGSLVWADISEADEKRRRQYETKRDTLRAWAAALDEAAWRTK